MKEQLKAVKGLIGGIIFCFTLGMFSAKIKPKDAPERQRHTTNIDTGIKVDRRSNPDGARDRPNRDSIERESAGPG